jgi:hypothetical protein
MRWEKEHESNQNISFSFNLDNRENNKEKENNILPPSREADGGGTKEECKENNFGRPLVDRRSTTKVGGQVEHKNVSKIINNHNADPFAIDPSAYETFEELLNAVLQYADEELYRSEETINHYRRYARLMATSEKENPFPIDFFNLNYAQFRYHMKWYKQNYYDAETGKNFYGLKHRKDVTEAFRKAYGLPDHPWNKYRLPPKPERKEVLVLEPKTFTKFFHFDGYDDDREINRYWQYIFFFGFMLGVRPPSELWMMRTNHLYDLKRPYIRVVEKKKHYSTRPLYLIDSLLHAKTRKSFSNFYYRIRPKFVSPNYKGDRLFISPYTGKPWTLKTFGKNLRLKGKLVDERYHPYCMRHTAAIMWITHKWEEKHPDPIRWVSTFLGHDTIKTTEERYLQHAEEYYYRHHFDWVKRALKFPKKWREESTLKSKQGPKTPVSNGIPSRSEYGPAEAQEWPTGEILFETFRFRPSFECIVIPFFFLFFGGGKPTTNIFLSKQLYYFRISPKFLLDGTSKMVRKDAMKTALSAWLTTWLTIGWFSGLKTNGQSRNEGWCEIG